MRSLGITSRPRPWLVRARSGAASSGVRVGSLEAGVVGSSVTTVEKLAPETEPWLEMLLTPAGIGGFGEGGRKEKITGVTLGRERGGKHPGGFSAGGGGAGGRRRGVGARAG